MLDTVGTIVVLYHGQIVSWKANRVSEPISPWTLSTKYCMGLNPDQLEFRSSPIFSGPDPFEAARVWRTQFPEHPEYMKHQNSAH